MKRMEFAQWGALSMGAKRDFKRAWDEELVKALREPALAVEASLLWISGAVAMGDPKAIRAIQAKPKEPMSWEPRFAARELGQNDQVIQGTGLACLERSPNHPIHGALLSAVRGEFACLEALLESIGPVVKIEALEHAVKLGEPAIFDAVMDSIDVVGDPEGGWPLRRELHADGTLKSSGFSSDDFEEAVVYPFGIAFEKAVCSGFVHAIQRMGEALGAQATMQGAKPDRLLTHGALSHCVEFNVDPIPALVAAIPFMERGNAKECLSHLKRSSERELASMRMDKARRDRIVCAVESQLLAFDMQAELADSGLREPSTKPRI